MPSASQGVSKMLSSYRGDVNFSCRLFLDVSHYDAANISLFRLQPHTAGLGTPQLALCGVHGLPVLSSHTVCIPDTSICHGAILFLAILCAFYGYNNWFSIYSHLISLYFRQG